MKKQLQKYCSIISGYAFSASDLKNISNVPVVKIGNISNGGNLIINSETQYVDESFLSINSKYHIKNKDVLISLTGSHINQPNSMVGKACRNYYKNTFLLNQRAGKILPKDGADLSYIYYFLTMSSTKNEIANRSYGGANQVNVSPKDIEKIKFDFPDFQTQVKVAGILSAYDDAIENNNKRIKILEQMAEGIYKEWFVRMRFPGFEKSEYENGLPKGWEVKRISELGKIETGKTPSTSNKEYYVDGKILFIKTPDMHKEYFVLDTEEKLTEQGSLSQIKKLLPTNSISVSCIGSAGVVSINTKPAHTNQQINSIILKNLDFLEWCFLVCKGLKETIELFGATGATMTNLSKGKFERLKIIYPKEDIIIKFHDKVCTVFTRIQQLLIVNQNLAKQRDLLLPRLMSGKLKVD